MQLSFQCGNANGRSDFVFNDGTRHESSLSRNSRNTPRRGLSPFAATPTTTVKRRLKSVQNDHILNIKA